MLARFTEQAQVMRSLATGIVVGLRRPPDIRLLPLQAPHVTATDVSGLVENATIADLQAHMASGRLTSLALTEYLIQKAVATEPNLHSLITFNPAALDEARTADARRTAGEAGGMLGIPLTIKDNIEVAGSMPTTGGAEILIGHAPDRDARIVGSLREAGAVILGKANMSELAGAMVRTPGFSAVGGQTANPRGDAFSPGGSSSGSAAGVAAGLAVASIGTETSGSLIVPGSFTGVVAMKPTYGALSNEGIIPLARHQDCAGPIARTVADASAVLSALTGGAVEAERLESLHGTRVGMLSEDIVNQRSSLEDTSESEALRQQIAATATAAGGDAVDTVVEAATFESEFLTVVFGGLAHDTIGYLRQAGAPVRTLADLQAYNLGRPRRRMPAGQALLSMAVARGISTDRYDSAALELRSASRRILDEAFSAAGADVLISVSNIHSSLYATAGYPAITIPMGTRPSGMPVGMTLIGRPGSDAWLLGVAAALEAVQ